MRFSSLGGGVALIVTAVAACAAYAAPTQRPSGAPDPAQASGSPSQPVSHPAQGNAEIRGKVGPSEIVIRTTQRLAGAIDSLTWNGREFIDSTDHGRQLQSACSFDCAGQNKFVAERYNPTEAGSRRDGAGPTSSSRLLRLKAAGNTLTTTTQMAFWLAPGETTGGWPAFNDRTLSDHRLTKRVQIGVEGLPHAIQYDVTFHVPRDERRHTIGQFEALTGYMPADFSRFFKLDLSSGKMLPLSDGPGEQSMPVILATPDGSHAMGVISPDQPSQGFESAGYGRFRFLAEKVVKWNCVFRVRSKGDSPQASIPLQDYHYRVYVAVGTLEDVRSTLMKLAGRFER